MIARIVSGGQSGADRAALDAAIAAGVQHGGWCPRGGWAEDLPDPPGVRRDYPELCETPDDDPAQRTRWNVRDSDGTLVLVLGDPAAIGGGAATTVAAAHTLARPCAVVACDAPEAAGQAAAFAAGLRDGAVLNVAGPRESEQPGIYAAARALLAQLLG